MRSPSSIMSNTDVYTIPMQAKHHPEPQPDMAFALPISLFRVELPSHAMPRPSLSTDNHGQAYNE